LRQQHKYPRIGLGTISSGILTVPLKIIYGLGRHINGTIIVGHMGHEILDDKSTIAGYAVWAVTGSFEDQ